MVALSAYVNTLYNLFVSEASSPLSTPFGSSTIGTGGSSANPTSGTTYTNNTGQLLVTISGGSGVSITTEDALGNTIDNAVASITNRILGPSYTITVTYTTAPTTTVTQLFYSAQNGSTGNVDYGGPSGAGSVSGVYADTVLQAVINALANGGSINLKAGIYWITNTVTVPYGLSFYMYGDGIPSYPYPFSVSAFTTPWDGTQIRGVTAFNSAGATTELIADASGTISQGVIGLFNLAIMPSYATTSSGTVVYGLYLTTHAIVIEDNLLFLPWGWTESGCDNPGGSNTICSQRIAPTKSSGANACGGGSEIRIGRLIEMGCLDASYLGGADNLTALSFVLWGCTQGPVCSCIWQNRILSIAAYNVPNFIIGFESSYRGNWVGQINIEMAGDAPYNNYIVYLSGTTYVRVDYVFMWTNITGYSQITSTTNDAQLEGSTLGWNVLGTALMQTFPLNKSTSLPFGGKVTSNLVTTSSPYTMGSGGSTMTLSSGQTYTVNEPLDITIGSGTSQSITTKDQVGNTIDNAVTTLTHRLLLSGYTITVTFTTMGTLTVYLATVGAGGNTSSPTASVNYVAYGYDVFVYASGGGSLSISVYDGSSNTRGNVLDGSLTSIGPRYLVRAGQVINYGAFTGSPTFRVSRY